MPTHIEPASGGLVTSRDPSVLQQGELQNGNGFIYLPDSDGAWRYPGGQFWATVAATAEDVNGLTACRFSNGNHYLVAQASGKLWTANAETDGSAFTSATVNVSGLSLADRLWSVQFDDRHYIFNGVDANRVLLPNGTTRQHGLDPANQSIQYIGTVSSAFSANATGYYEYWYTEVVKFPDGQELESTFEGIPLTVYVTATTTAPELELPSTPANQFAGGTAIYYNVYRSEMKANINDSLYPIGRKIGTSANVDTSGGTTKVRVKDTSAVTSTGTKTPASNDANAKGTRVTIVQGSATSATFTRASGGALLPTDTAGVIFMHNFSPGTFTGNIIGLSVNVTASSSVADIADLFVVPVHRASGTPGSVSHDQIPASGGQPAFYPGFVTTFPTGGNLAPASTFPAGTKSSKRQTITTTSPTNYSYGSTSDDWLPAEYSWKIQDFDSNFGFHVMVVFNSKAVAGNTVTINGFNVNIHYVGTSTSTKLDQKTYDAVIVEQGGVSLKYGANNRPPVASCGTVFEGSLVTNNIAEDGMIMWSVPDNPDYFPTPVYWMLMPADDMDEITFLGVVNNRLIVGMQSSIYRVNYLPNETDSSFHRGRAVHPISRTIGIINPSCACQFTNAFGRQELAFVDTNGIYATDGETIRKLSADLLWIGPSSRNPVWGVSTGGSIKGLVNNLINSPVDQTIRMIKSNGDVYCGSYAPRHAKPGGGLKWSKSSVLYSDGVTSYQPSCTTTFRRANGAWVIVHGYDYGVIGNSAGGIVREDGPDATTYHTLLSGITPFLQTRDMYLAGLGNEIEIQSLTLHARDFSTGSTARPPTGAATITQQYTNGTHDQSTGITFSNQTSNCKLVEMGVGSVNADAFNIRFDFESTGMWELNSFLMEGQGFGESENRG